MKYNYKLEDGTDVKVTEEGNVYDFTLSKNDESHSFRFIEGGGEMEKNVSKEGMLTAKEMEAMTLLWSIKR